MSAESFRMREQRMAQVIAAFPSTPVEANVEQNYLRDAKGLELVLKAISPELKAKKIDLRKRFDRALTGTLTKLEEKRKVLRTSASRASARENMAQDFLNDLINAKDMVERNLAPESVYPSAVREYRRNMRESGLVDLMVNLGTPAMTEARKAAQKPSVKIDVERKRVQINDSVVELDDITIEALRLFEGADFVRTREIGDLARKHGFKGNYPAQAIYKRLAKITEKHPDLIEEYEESAGKMLKLNGDLQFGVVEAEKTVVSSTKARSKRQTLAPAGVLTEETGSNVPEKRDTGIQPEKIAAIRKFLLEAGSTDEVIDLLGPTKSGKRFTRAQAAWSLINNTRFLLIRKTSGLITPDEQALYDDLSTSYGNAEGKFFDSIVEKLSAWRSGEDISAASSLRPKGTTTKTELESLSEVGYDNKDLHILALMLMSRLGTDIRTMQGSHLIRFSIPDETLDAVRNLAGRAKREDFVIREIDLRREKIIDSFPKLMQDQDLGRFKNPDVETWKVIAWMHDYLLDQEILRQNFAQVLSKIPQRDASGRKYIEIAFAHLLSNGDAETVQADQGQNKTIEAAESIVTEQTDVVLPIGTPIEITVTEVPTEEVVYKTAKPEEQKFEDVTPTVAVEHPATSKPEKSPWADFEKRDAEIRIRIAEIVEEVLDKSPGTLLTGTRLVGEFIGVTDRLQDIAVKNEVVKPIEKRGAIPLFDLAESAKLIYYCRYGKNISLRPRDYKKMSGPINEKLASIQAKREKEAKKA